MAKPSGNRWVGRILLLSALGCGASSVLLLPVNAMLGLALAVVAFVDLGVVWLLRWCRPVHAEAGVSG